MLNYPESTNSTFWEGYHKDGTFAYKGIYMSNSHGWAAGPAAALSRYVLGVAPTSPGGLHYRVAPQPGDLEHCEGQLHFAADHVVRVAWRVHGAPSALPTFTLRIDATALHPDSVGVVGVPLHPTVVEAAGLLPLGPLVILRNGAVVWRGDERSGEIRQGRVWLDVPAPTAATTAAVRSGISDVGQFAYHEYVLSVADGTTDDALE
jgi:hypothetical protein